MKKQGVRKNHKNNATEHMQGGKSKPKNRQQPHMFLDSAPARVAGYRANHFSATATTEALIRLQLFAALITKHNFPPLRLNQITSPSGN
jgi:hypothetical protein